MLKLTRSITIITTVMSALMLGACASNQERIDRFVAFADAGTAYTTSVTGLLDASLVTAITADNQVLIRARELKKNETFLQETFDEHTVLTEGRAEVLGEISKQTHLIKDYFATLGLLASSADDGAAAKATSGLSEATEKLAGELGELSSKVENATIGDQSVSGFLGSLAPLVIGAYQRKELDRVLEATAEPVSRSLNVHKAALKAIREQMEDERGLISDRKFDALILKPYLGSGDLPKDWGKHRLEWLTEEAEIRELDQAVAASEKLEIAFRKLLANGADGPSFMLLLQDLKGLAAFTKKLV